MTSPSERIFRDLTSPQARALSWLREFGDAYWMDYHDAGIRSSVMDRLVAKGYAKVLSRQVTGRPSFYYVATPDEEIS